MNLHPSGIAVLAGDKEILIIYDLLTETKVIKIPYYTSEETRINISPDGRLVAISNYRTTIVDIFELPSGRKIRAINNRQMCIFDVLFNMDNTELIFKTFGLTIDTLICKFDDIYNIDEEPTFANLALPIEGPITAIFYNCDCSKLAIGMNDKLKIWDLRLNKFIYNMKFKVDDYIYCIKFSPDDTKIAVSFNQCIGGIGDITNVTIFSLLEIDKRVSLANFGSLEYTTFVEFSPDSSQFIEFEIVDDSDDNTICVFNSQDCEQIGTISKEIKEFDNAVKLAIFDITGTRLIVLGKPFDWARVEDVKVIDNPFRKPSGILTKAAVHKM